MGKMNLTEAEHERRSQLAKDLTKRVDPVTGRALFGGKQPGAGRPKKVRATEKLNEKIIEATDDIWRRLENEMKNGKSMNALAAIRQMIDIANKETDIQVKEEQNLEEIPTEELLEMFASRMARLAESGLLDYDIDGTAEDLGEAEVIESGDRGSGEDSWQEDEPQGSDGTGQANAGLGASPFARRAENG